jgi:hypothetical protein
MMDEARVLTRISLLRLLPTDPECVSTLDYFEPYVPWQADFLSFRAACYRTHNPALAVAAMHDLTELLRALPASL